MNLETRITHNPLQCGGKLCIRNMRIRVSDILQMLGEGISSEEILQDFPDLEQQDIQACLLYTARRANLALSFAISAHKCINIYNRNHPILYLL